MITEAFSGGDLLLVPGWWVLGFLTRPTAGSDPASNVVDDPTGAVIGIQVHVSPTVVIDESVSGSGQRIGLQERTAREISRGMFQVERRVHGPDGSRSE